MSFYDKYKELCAKNGESPTIAAHKIGFSSTTASGWKNNNAVPQPRTVKKIADYFGVPVEYLLNDDATLPEQTKKSPTTELVVEDMKLYKIPVYDSVSAGFGALAKDEVIDFTYLPLKSQTEADDTICITVRGDSMSPKIMDGDRAVIHRQTSVDSGDVAVVLIGEDEGYIKRIEYGSDYIKLISLNEGYDPIIFKGREVLNVGVVGKVKEIIRRL